MDKEKVIRIVAIISHNFDLNVGLL